jgi:hypothetical protein
MAPASSARTAGTPARDLGGGNALRLAAVLAVLTLAPPLARVARAQRGASIVAAATVTNSVINAAVAATLVSAAPVAPAPGTQVRCPRVPGIGVVSVRTGPDQPIRIALGVPDPRTPGECVVQIAYVGS